MSGYLVMIIDSRGFFVRRPSHEPSRHRSARLRFSGKRRQRNRANVARLRPVVNEARPTIQNYINAKWRYIYIRGCFGVGYGTIFDS